MPDRTLETFSVPLAISWAVFQQWGLLANYWDCQALVKRMSQVKVRLSVAT